MRSWIFQATPKTFDIDLFLAENFKAFTWLVSRYAQEISVGDRVYIWRAAAGEKEKSGVIAEAIVTSLVADIPSDENGINYWVNPEDAHVVAQRVWLQLVRRGTGKEMLRRDWLLEDPILKDMLILRLSVGTNFLLTDGQSQRLAKMWAHVGQNWARNESLAGLWAYARTLDREVSKKPGSPVAEVSQLTGRAITGVYNKVMNFRSLDPRDSRAGMSGGGKTDRIVWAEYFNAEHQELDVEEIDKEFQRLWGDPAVYDDAKPDAGALNAATEREAERLLGKPLTELLASYDKHKAIGSKSDKPSVRSASSRVYDRNPLVVAIARARSAEQCEVPECRHPLFQTREGRPYVEVHHLVPLAEGGADSIENVACICPAHHREAHFGKDAEKLFDQLRKIRQESEALGNN